MGLISLRFCGFSYMMRMPGELYFNIRICVHVFKEANVGNSSYATEVVREARQNP